MAKEWVLNIATNRWGLNKKNKVGPVAQWIREASPKSVDEWEQAYLKRLAQWLQERKIPLSPEAYLHSLGERLYVKISEVLRQEVEGVTLEDCVAYIRTLVIHRTFEGYRRELQTVYEQLRAHLQVEIEPAPDEVDRTYHVDFWIPVGARRIGIQIKPITYMQQSDVHRWLSWMEQAHKGFERKFGGRVFVVFSRKEGRRHVIANPEVIKALREELQRLQQESGHASSPSRPD